MLQYALKKQTTAKLIRLNIFYFLFFLGLYSLIDSFNMSYAEMALQFGTFLPIVNILINVLMAFLSMAMIGLTTAQFDFIGKESQGSNMSFISVIFGILTYGCTPCVISFFAAIGISFSVAVLPLAGLPYKLMSLALLIIGLAWVMISLQRTTCKLPKPQVKK
ncbi:MAG: hypothetical protein ACO3BB_01395 [Bacilli bacterium]